LLRRWFSGVSPQSVLTSYGAEGLLRPPALIQATVRLRPFSNFLCGRRRIRRQILRPRLHRERCCKPKRTAHTRAPTLQETFSPCVSSKHLQPHKLSAPLDEQPLRLAVPRIRVARQRPRPRPRGTNPLLLHQGVRYSRVTVATASAGCADTNASSPGWPFRLLATVAAVINA